MINLFDDWFNKTTGAMPYFLVSRPFQVVGWFLLLMASKQLTGAMKAVQEGSPIVHIKATCKIVGKIIQYNYSGWSNVTVTDATHITLTGLLN